MKEDNMKQGWEIKKLGEVCEVIGGSTPKTNEPTYWDGDFFWVTPAELDGTKLISSTKRTITEAGIKSAHLQLLPAGTVLLSSRAPIGKVAITTVPMYCNQGFKNIICSDKLYNCYVYWFLYAKTEYLNALGTGATFKEISKKVVEQIPIPVPPLPVQERIVSELDLLSGIIEKKREQLKEFDALAQSIFYDMFGDPITNEKGWEVKKLGEVCDDITDGDHMPPPKSETGIPFLTISDIDKEKRELNFNDTFFVPQEYYDNLKENRRAKKGDVLYTVTGSYGIPVIVNTCKHFCFQRHIALLKPKQENLLSLFLCQWFLCEGVKFMADQVATGIAQKTVSLTSIRKFEIILPPLPLQHQFATKIEAIEKQKELIKQSISETETLFNARMQHYFN